MAKATPEVATGGFFLRKDTLRNFAKLSGKHLCQSLFLIKLQGFFFTEPLLVTASATPLPFFDDAVDEN